jgi:8-oxo-dGTP pyrophosphatase MutT (NUDIX family)
MGDRSCVLLLRGERLLMVRQTDRGRIFWTLPGGAPEPGETPAAAAVREAREETGLDVALVRLLDRRPRAGASGTHHCFLGRIVRGEPVLGRDPERTDAGPELHQLAWIPLAHLRDHPEVAPLLARLKRDAGGPRPPPAAGSPQHPPNDRLGEPPPPR